MSSSLVAQMVKNSPAMQETRVQSLVEKIPWRREWQPTPTVLPGKFHGQRSSVGYSPWGHKESVMTEQLTLPFFHVYVQLNHFIVHLKLTRHCKSTTLYQKV